MYNKTKTKQHKTHNMNAQTNKLAEQNKEDFFAMVAAVIESQKLAVLDDNAEEWFITAKRLKPETDYEKKIFGCLARTAIRVRRIATETEVDELQRKIATLKEGFLRYQGEVEMEELAITF